MVLIVEIFQGYGWKGILYGIPNMDWTECMIASYFDYEILTNDLYI